jgi:hypothetical protein
MSNLEGNDIDPNELFFPNKAIRQENKQFFAGRGDLLSDACLRVGKNDFSAVIYGDRGVGKTSFAWQLLERISGDLTLAENEGLNLHNCKCIWLQCREDMQNIEGVLLSLLKDSTKNFTFSKEFPTIFNDGEFRNKLQRRHEIDFSTLSLRDIYTQKFSIRELFHDVIEACKPSDGTDQSIIIFLDEFDSLPDRSNFGKLIKATDDARFVIIGIADSVDEIIKDHLSAGRKLAGSTFRIPRFNDQEINFVFDKAEQVANHQIVFEPEFREQVIFRSYGYPYLVQQFGFYSTETAFKSDRATDNLLQIKVGDLKGAINILFTNLGDRHESLFDILRGDGVKKEILRIVAQETNYILVANIKSRISSLRMHVEQNVRDLIKMKVFKRVEDNRVRFVDPEARILTQVYFDSEQKS